jgi:hypothetical protein
MSWTGCEESTWWVTWALRQEETQARVVRAVDAGAPASIIIDRVVSGLDDRVAGIVREELEALPSATVLSIIDAWRLAAAGCKPFELASARPERPIEAARSRRVRLVVDVTEEGVRAEISHVASRHPTWQLSATAVEAGREA